MSVPYSINKPSSGGKYKYLYIMFNIIIFLKLKLSNIYIYFLYIYKNHRRTYDMSKFSSNL
jgi:hypothetical protein